MLTLTGKRALITGATNRLGLSLACWLVNPGVEVILNGRSSEKIAAALGRLSMDVPAAGIAASFAANLITRTGVRSLVAQQGAAHSTIDLVGNHAGAAFARFQVNEEGWNAASSSIIRRRFSSISSCCPHLLRKPWWWTSRIPAQDLKAAASANQPRILRNGSN